MFRLSWHAYGKVTTVSQLNQSSHGTTDKSFFGHPKVLANLFGVEVWERFSFYGMQGIVLIYMYYSVSKGGLGLDKSLAAGIVGGYGGTVYICAILGGWLADRVLGAERVLFFSAIVVMCGHIFLGVLPGFAGLFAGLICIAMGSGGVKATATSLVGTLYSTDDERRDAGFSLFYMGINLGALVGPFLTGILQKEWGFHFGFSLAALGMAIGLIQYSLGRKNLPESGKQVPNPLPKSKYPMLIGIAVGGVAVLVILTLVHVITAANLALVVIGAAAVAAIVYFVVILRNRSISGVERKRVLAFIPMLIANSAFWSLYQQQFTVVTIYADERLNRSLFGWEMPVSWAQSINPVFIIVLAGVFAAVWTKLGDRQPSTPTKFVVGMAVMGIAFLLFITMAGTGMHGAPLLGLVGVIFVFTVAELFISPVGLSLATKLAPKIFQTQTVSLYFLSVAIGTAMAGELAKWYSPGNEVAYFGIIGGAGIVVALLLLAFIKPIRKLMSGVH